MSNSDRIIGIDLGTTHSCVAIMEGGKPVIIENAEGGRTTPSVVAFKKSSERLVGQVAKRQSVTNPLKTIQSIKREMGTNYRVTIDGVSHSPEQVSAMILQKLKADAESYLGEKLSRAVITVPAYFNDAQRQATRDAGQIAGLDVMRIINEPTASALAYGLDKLDDHATILVFDLGGGTFDVSILEITEGVFEVKATSGNNRLGGDDFDNAIIEWMVSDFFSQTSIDVSNDLIAVQRFKETAEKTKIELSTAAVSEIHLPFLTADYTGPLHFQSQLTRAKFNELTAHLVDDCLGPLQQALDDSQLEPSEIENIILVGGSTRIPAVQDMIRRFFSKEPSKSVNPDEAVAMGAAIQASILAGDLKEVLLLDVIPLSLGIETAGELFTRIIRRNTTIPTSQTQLFSTTEDGQTSVEVHVLQGEREKAKDNKSLAKLHLPGIPPAPRGVPKIEVTFDIDADGILQCSVKDHASGLKQSITIQRTTGLNPEEVEELTREAEEFAEQDRIERERINARVKADAACADAERTITKYGDRVDKAIVDKVRRAIDNVKEDLTKDDIEELNPHVAGLEVALMDFGRLLHQTKPSVRNTTKKRSTIETIELGKSQDTKKLLNNHNNNDDSDGDEPLEKEPGENAIED